jgi:sulfatase maturation enzyme AslB (radical SAM superfamily)
MTWCPLPFRHVFVEPRGVKPCCSYTKMHESTIEQWLGSQELGDLQRNILDGQIPEGCRHCAQGEQRDGTSTRLAAIHDYGSAVTHNTVIDYVDYRSNNICNFRCRSCDPFYSNGIAQEARRHPELQRFYPIPTHKTAPTQTQDKQWIIDNLGSIKRLMFTGGEPTRIPEVREIIDRIRHSGNQDISVMMTSNASFSDPYWFEITESMPNIHWTLSIDSVGSAAEIIRDGTDWSQVSATVERMFDIAPSVNIGTVVTNLSLTQLDLLFAWANQLKDRYSHRSNGRTHFIEICNWPQYLSPYNWPEHRRESVIVFLETLCSQPNLQEKQQQVAHTLLSNIQNTAPNAELWAEFEAYNKTLDNTRNQDHTQLLDTH